jgi:hypothetical protein
MFGTADQDWDRTNWMHSRPQPKTQQEIEFYGKTDEEPPF